MRCRIRFTLFVLGLFVTTQAVAYEAQLPITYQSPLPPGIPETSVRKADCFLSGEEADWLARRPRLRLEGCSQGVLAPTTYLDLNTPYKLGKSSLFSCQRLRRYTYNVQALNSALAEFNALADAAAHAGVQNNQMKCLVNTLELWANRNGMINANPDAVENEFRQNHAVRAWYASGFGTVYLKLKNLRQAAISMKKARAIKRWFDRLGRIILDDTQAPYATDKDRHKKNIYFWKGYALTVISVITGNAEYAGEGRRIFDLAVDEIQSSGSSADKKGFLKNENQRNGKAQQYHHFSALPIMGMFNISRALNCTFVKSIHDTNRIAFLLRKTSEGQQNPSIFLEATGSVQNGLKTIDNYAYMLGTDAEAEYIIEMASTYLLARGLRFRASSLPPGKHLYLGGRVGNMPAPGALKAFKNKSFAELCVRPGVEL